MARMMQTLWNLLTLWRNPVLTWELKHTGRDPLAFLFSRIAVITLCGLWLGLLYLLPWAFREEHLGAAQIVGFHNTLFAFLLLSTVLWALARDVDTIPADRQRRWLSFVQLTDLRAIEIVTAKWFAILYRIFCRQIVLLPLATIFLACYGGDWQRLAASFTIGLSTAALFLAARVWGATLPNTPSNTQGTAVRFEFPVLLLGLTGLLFPLTEMLRVTPQLGMNFRSWTFAAELLDYLVPTKTAYQLLWQANAPSTPKLVGILLTQAFCTALFLRAAASWLETIPQREADAESRKTITRQQARFKRLSVPGLLDRFPLTWKLLRSIDLLPSALLSYALLLAAPYIGLLLLVPDYGAYAFVIGILSPTYYLVLAAWIAKRIEDERVNGTWSLLLVSGLEPAQYVWGYWLAGIMLAAVSAGVLGPAFFLGVWLAEGNGLPAICFFLGANLYGLILLLLGVRSCLGREGEGCAVAFLAVLVVAVPFYWAARTGQPSGLTAFLLSLFPGGGLLFSARSIPNSPSAGLPIFLDFTSPMLFGMLVGLLLHTALAYWLFRDSLRCARQLKDDLQSTVEVEPAVQPESLDPKTGH